MTWLGKVLRAAMTSATVTLTALASATPKSQPLPLLPLADVPLPGNATRFDYQWLDPVGKKLYIAHLGDSALVVFDIAAQRVGGEVPDLPSVHGVVAAPDLNWIFATATAQKTLAVIQDQTLEVRARIPAGDYPNGLAYDPKTNRVFVSNNSGHGIAVIDVKSARALPSIDIGGGAGNSQYDSESGHVFVTVHGRPVLVEIEPSTAKISERIALHGVSSCHGLLVAPHLRRAFAACRGAAPRLVAVDLEKRSQVAAVPLQEDVDVLAFDPGLGRLYAAAETGIVSAYAVAAQVPSELGRGFVAPNAHSVAVDPVTHRVYLPLMNVGGHPVLRIMNPAEGPVPE